MNFVLLALLFVFNQDQITVVKNNGDVIVFTDATIFQQENEGSNQGLSYSYRGKVETITLDKIKRISFKETIKKKKGITTYRAILVRTNNTKLEIDIDLVSIDGVTDVGKNESMSFSSVDKISF